MNTLTVPSTPNWYHSNILCCAPDGTVIYGARRDVVILTPSNSTRSADVRYIYPAHSERVVAVAIDNENWGKPAKLVASTADDNMVRLWDSTTATLKLAHKAHVDVEGKAVDLTFVDNQVISITTDGHMVVWCILSNVARVLQKIIWKHHVKCLATCPHRPNMSAVGTNYGFVFVINTKANGKLLYKVRTQDYDVLSLSFCPTPFNIFTTPYTEELAKPHNVDLKAAGDSVVNSENLVPEKTLAKSFADMCIDFQKDRTENPPEAASTPPAVLAAVENTPEKVVKKKKRTPVPTDKKNPWANLEFPDDSENEEDVEPSEDLEKTTPKDFLTECLSLRSDIVKMKEAEVVTPTPASDIPVEGSSESSVSGKSRTKNNTPNSGIILSPVASVDHRLTSRLMGLLRETGDDADTTYDYLDDSIVEENISVVDTPKECIATEIPSEVVEHESVESGSDAAVGDSKPVEILVEGDKICSPVAKSVVEPPAADKGGYTYEEPLDSIDFNEMPIENYLLLNKLKGNSHLNSSLASSLNVEVDESEICDDASTVGSEITESVEKDLVSETESGTAETGQECIQDITDNPEDNLRVESAQTVMQIDTDSVPLVTENEEAKITKNVPDHKDMLLATCAKGGFVSIWRMGGDGRLQTSLRLPTNKRQGRDRRGRNQPDWTTVCWATPNQILVSSPSGELLAWQVPPKNANDSRKPRLIHSDHAGTIFCIAVPQLREGDQKFPLYAWTVSLDRWLLCTSISGDRRSLMSYPTFSGYIHAIVVSPLDPNRMAVASGDQTLRLFDLSRPHSTNINMTIIYQKIKDKILVAAWHPVKETCIAFATTDGRMGLVDTGSQSKSITFFHQYFRGPVHAICWGPAQKSNAYEKYSLYACAEGIVVTYSPVKPQLEPQVLKLGSDDIVTTISWKHNFQVFTVGCKGGAVKLMTPQLDLIVTLYSKKTVQYVTWHPEMTAEDLEKSPYVNWLAIATNDFAITVFNCDDLYGPDHTVKQVALIPAHEQLICMLAWNPHIGGQLVSVSYDSTAKVWDILTETMISTFVGHGDYVNCVLWSPFDADLIFSGGRDCTLRVWRISENPPCTITKTKSKKFSQTTVLSDLMDKSNGNASVVSTDISDTVGKGSDEKIPEMLATIKDDVAKKNALYKTLFPNLSRRQNRKGKETIANIRSLIKCLESRKNAVLDDPEAPSEPIDSESVDEQTTETETNPTHFFESQLSALSLIEYERQRHLEWSSWDAHAQLSLWKGDTKALIENAAEKKMLNSWLVSLAPMVSNAFWRTACSMYAEQLKTEDRPFLAISYLLASNQVEEAIELLVSIKFYREAIALAYSRLSEDDPCLSTLFRKWGEESTFTGNYEVAAQCYLALGDFNQAAILLAKRTDNDSLQLALELAQKLKNSDLEKSILAQLAEKIVEKPKSTVTDKEEKETQEVLNIPSAVDEATDNIDPKEIVNSNIE